MLGNLLGGFIIVLVGVNLAPVIADGIYDARYINSSGGSTVDNTMLTGTSGVLLGLVSIFFSLGVMAAGVSVAVGGLKNAGIM